MRAADNLICRHAALSPIAASLPRRNRRRFITGIAIGSASISCRNWNSATAIQAALSPCRFTFAALSPGQYGIRIDAPGYQSQELHLLESAHRRAPRPGIPAAAPRTTFGKRANIKVTCCPIPTRCSPSTDPISIPAAWRLSIPATEPSQSGNLRLERHRFARSQRTAADRPRCLCATGAAAGSNRGYYHCPRPRVSQSTDNGPLRRIIYSMAWRTITCWSPVLWASSRRKRWKSIASQPTIFPPNLAARPAFWRTRSAGAAPTSGTAWRYLHLKNEILNANGFQENTQGIAARPDEGSGNPDLPCPALS